MKPLIYLSLLLLLISSCKCNTEKKSKKFESIKAKSLARQTRETANDTIEVDPSTLGCLPKAYIHGYDEQEFSPGTFNTITYVYNSSKPDAKIIDTLSFNTSVNILKEYPEFYLVCTIKAKSGYIKKTDLYLNKMFGGADMSYYLVGITTYPQKKDREWGNDCHNSALKFVKIEDKSNKILCTYIDSILGVSYSIKSINSVALKNAKAMFHINYNCMQEIETDEDLFIIDNGKKISKLFLTSSSGDGGDGEGTMIYLPVTLVNGKKIVLAKEGVVSVDPETAKPDIFPYPADCGIPIDELIVVQNWSEEAVEDGKPEYNSDGTAVQTTTITSTTYYRWDGNVLTKVKTIKGK